MLQTKAFAVIRGRYTIRVMELGGQWKARAFLTNAPVGTRHLAEDTAKTKDDAVAAVAAALDERDRGLRAQWRLDEKTGFFVPTAGEYELAVQVASLSDSQLMMLKAHAAAGDAGMSALQLAQAGGYADFSSANVHYGKAGRKLADQMHAEIPASRVRAGEDVPTTAIAAWLPTPDEPGNSGRWIMHPELREAVSRLL